MESELTKEIKSKLHNFKPVLNSRLRTIKYAEEVWTPTGIVDVIRFEDCIKKDNSYCIKTNDITEEKCKVPGLTFPNPNCRGCVFKRSRYEYGILTTCFEIKITFNDFQSIYGHNFCGNKNYYVVPEYLFKKIEPEVPKNIGIIVYNPDNGRLKTKRESVYTEIENEILVKLLYNSLKKWCDKELLNFQAFQG